METPLVPWSEIRVPREQWARAASDDGWVLWRGPEDFLRDVTLYAYCDMDGIASEWITGEFIFRAFVPETAIVAHLRRQVVMGCLVEKGLPRLGLRGVWRWLRGVR
jgi:hypothetical protein